jgi:nucleoside-diphosphate-sugar epimerase
MEGDAMKVLFIGGTGIISAAVSQRAVEKGVQLTLVNRGNRGDFLPRGATHIAADARDRAALRTALSGLSFDTVVDWLAFTREQVEDDIALFGGRCGQYIFISSASVYQKPPTRFPITESTPLANPYWHPGQCTIDEASNRLTDRIIDACQAGLKLGGA